MLILKGEQSYKQMSKKVEQLVLFRLSSNINIRSNSSRNISRIVLSFLYLLIHRKKQKKKRELPTNRILLRVKKKPSIFFIHLTQHSTRIYMYIYTGIPNRKKKYAEGKNQLIYDDDDGSMTSIQCLVYRIVQDKFFLFFFFSIPFLFVIIRSFV